MSWIPLGENQDENQFLEKLEAERDEARKILISSEFVNKVIFTDCMIPLQIDAILPSGEMCYGRNERVGGNVTMWVFEKECDLSKGWPPVLYTGKKNADATDYIVLAQEMLVLIKQYLETKKTVSC